MLGGVHSSNEGPIYSKNRVIMFWVKKVSNAIHEMVCNISVTSPHLVGWKEGDHWHWECSLVSNSPANGRLVVQIFELAIVEVHSKRWLQDRCPQALAVPHVPSESKVVCWRPSAGSAQKGTLQNLLENLLELLLNPQNFRYN